ncbi:MAG: hypothetical protein ACHQIM_01225 [Sphingobacteriales bacterium]
MKMQNHYNSIRTRSCCISSRFSAGMILVFCMFSSLSFSQVVNVVSPVTSQTYNLPDPAGMQTAADVQGGITTAETAGKALCADAAKERAIALKELNKAKIMSGNYQAALNNFSKNEVAPYNTDLNNYTASGTMFNESLAAYNKAVLANNALAAKDRKAATVAGLNKQKAQIDVWGIKLTKWKSKLDAAKAKLDVDNAALQKQKQNADAAAKTADDKLKVTKPKLNGLLDQLTICANYAWKCHELLMNKFNSPKTTDDGYFSTPAYKSAIADLVSAMKLKV